MTKESYGYPVPPEFVASLFNKKNHGFRVNANGNEEVLRNGRWRRSIRGMTWRQWIACLFKGCWAVDPEK